MNQQRKAETEEERKKRERRERELRERALLTVTLKPDRIPLKHALVLLGGMSRSAFYVKAAKGVFDLFKEGEKTTVGMPSIERYNASLPRARIGKQVGA